MIVIDITRETDEINKETRWKCVSSVFFFGSTNRFFFTRYLQYHIYTFEKRPQFYPSNEITNKLIDDWHFLFVLTSHDLLFLDSSVSHAWATKRIKIKIYQLFDENVHRSGYVISWNCWIYLSIDGDNKRPIIKSSISLKFSAQINHFFECFFVSRALTNGKRDREN